MWSGGWLTSDLVESLIRLPCGVEFRFVPEPTDSVEKVFRPISTMSLQVL